MRTTATKPGATVRGRGPRPELQDSRLPGRRRRAPGAGSRARLLVAALVVLLGAGVGQGAGVRGTALEDYRSLRYGGVIGQTDWYTCGPAAAATLLQHYVGIPATETEMLELAVQVMAAAGEDPQDGISALALVRALERKGVPARGYRLDLAALKTYFQQGGLPVIVHVTRPEPHYVVAVGSVGPWVLLADPSWGRHLVSWTELDTEKGFTGVVLVPVPPPELAAAARALQQAALAWAEDRWAQLEQWGGGRL